MEPLKVVCGVSARHLHLSEKDLALLFGEGSCLTNIKDLNQPGQFACDQRVDLVGPKNTIKNVRVLTNFAKEHGLLQPKVTELLKGTRNIHKGWVRAED